MRRVVCLVAAAIAIAVVACMQTLRAAPVSSADPREIVAGLIHVLQSSPVGGQDLAFLSPRASTYIRNNVDRARLLEQAGTIVQIDIVGRNIIDALNVFELYATHSRGSSRWWIGYRPGSEQVDSIAFTASVNDSSDPGSRDLSRSTPKGTPIHQDACQDWPPICGPDIRPMGDPRIVEFTFATTRQMRDLAGARTYSGERSETLNFGAARVSIPAGHHNLGHIELPRRTNVFGYSLYEEKLDPTKHFVIREMRTLAEDDWKHLLQDSNQNEVLVFVHGFNTSFEDALYRQAQIIWDLQYKGTAVLFTWASRGGALDYVYDQQSALLARKSFISLLSKLRNELGFAKINVIAHSMGNLVVADALANNSSMPGPVRLQELIMAAPDLDWNYFQQVAPDLRKVSDAVTLYASSSDRAMMLSKAIASGVPRAGDILNGEPIVVAGVESIDVTALGDELFGLNHDVFASSRSTINDIGLILGKHLHPPEVRLPEIRGVPIDAATPRFWKYTN
jgi:esterase/lipase superfamily enzyme